jgi:hypothetical protein
MSGVVRSGFAVLYAPDVSGRARHTQMLSWTFAPSNAQKPVAEPLPIEPGAMKGFG